VTTRYEGAGAKDTRITVHAAGEEIGDDVVPEGQIALAFSYDEVFYIQGTPGEVAELIGNAERLLKSVIHREETPMTAASQKMYRELAGAIANLAEAIAEGKIPSKDRPGQVALLKNNIDTLQAWTKQGWGS
jgi:hypothetical protein